MELGTDESDEESCQICFLNSEAVSLIHCVRSLVSHKRLIGWSSSIANLMKCKMLVRCFPCLLILQYIKGNFFPVSCPSHTFQLCLSVCLFASSSGVFLAAFLFICPSVFVSLCLSFFYLHLCLFLSLFYRQFVLVHKYIPKTIDSITKCFSRIQVCFSNKVVF